MISDKSFLTGSMILLSAASSLFSSSISLFLPDWTEIKESLFQDDNWKFINVPSAYYLNTYSETHITHLPQLGCSHQLILANKWYSELVELLLSCLEFAPSSLKLMVKRLIQYNWWLELNVQELFWLELSYGIYSVFNKMAANVAVLGWLRYINISVWNKN